MRSDEAVIDLRDVILALRRGWRWIVGGAISGLLLAVLLTLLFPERYQARSTVLLRSVVDGARSQLAGGSSGGQKNGFSFGGLADMLSLASGFDTEIEILTSQAVIGSVVDSLGLQARVVKPERLPVRAVFGVAWFDPNLEAATYRFERAGDQWTVTGPGVRARVAPGGELRLNQSRVVLRERGLPAVFEVELVDRADAIERIVDRLEVERAGGEIAELVYRAPDPVTAAAVPNAMIAVYLARRTTTDRGVNQHRYEFLAARADSIARELALAEAALRRVQERTGVLDPAIQGKAELERGIELRAALEQTEVEARAFRQLIDQAEAGTLPARQLAAYPTFLRNEAIGNLLSAVLELDTKRTELLERRTERDPDVRALTEQIEALEGQIVSLAATYLDGLQRQQVQLRADFGRYEGILAELPAQAEVNYRAQREVQRLSETLLALQGQLVQARLAAIAEGGEVRQIDVAFPPKKPVWPKPLLNLVIGLSGGLLVGLIMALGSRYLGRRVRSVEDAEQAAGVPAFALDGRTPLLLGGARGKKALLVVPVGAADSEVVARRLATAAVLQGRNTVLADLREAPLALLSLSPEAASAPPAPRSSASLAEELHPAETGDGEGYLVYRASANGHAQVDARLALEELERRFATVVVALPMLDQAPTAALLAPERPVVLAARAGASTRAGIRDAAEAMMRLGVPVAGVVLSFNGHGGRHTAG